MLWLPSLNVELLADLSRADQVETSGSPGITIPLCDADCEWLVEQLLLRSRQARPSGSLRVPATRELACPKGIDCWLRRAPNVAAWSYLTLRQSLPPASISFATLADRLVSELQAANAADRPVTVQSSPDREVANRWRMCEAQALATADYVWVQVQPSSRHEASSPGPSWFGGLPDPTEDQIRLPVYLAMVLLRGVAPAFASEQVAVLLRTWFGEAIASRVLQAVAAFADCDGLAATGNLPVAAADIWVRAWDHAARWCGPAGGRNEPAAGPRQESSFASRILPALLADSSRLEQLERHFDEAVESAMLIALKELAYGASHEINNPLMNISTRAQTLLLDEQDPERRQALAKIASQAFRAHEMISDLMLFAKPPTMECREVHVLAVVAECLAELAGEASEQGTTLTCVPPWNAASAAGELDAGSPANGPGAEGRVGQEATLWWELDPDYLAEALKALVRNSLEAVKAGGRIEVRVRLVGDPATELEIVVADSGPGIPDALRNRLFVPYFSGREAGRGLGVGLGKSWRILQAHGGTIRVDRPEMGARLVLTFPRQKTVAPPKKTPAKAAHR